MNEKEKTEMSSMGEEIAAVEKKYKEYYEVCRKNQKLREEATQTYYRIMIFLIAGMVICSTQLYYEVVLPIIDIALRA